MSKNIGCWIEENYSEADAKLLITYKHKVGILPHNKVASMLAHYDPLNIDLKGICDCALKLKINWSQAWANYIWHSDFSSFEEYKENRVAINRAIIGDAIDG